jgi:prolipoprotein diacylglyceryltransferase
LAIQLPGLLLLLGLWLASLMVARQAVQHGLDGNVLDRLMLLSLVAGLLGARVGYVLKHASIYLEDPLGILSLNPVTLSAVEGAVAGLLAAVLYGQRKRLALWPTLDALSAGVAVLAVFLALSHLTSGDAFGAPAAVPWAIQLWGAQRHPAQVYELLAALAVLLAVLILEKHQAFAGQLAWSWLALASASRLILEAFRGDSLYLAGVRQAQVGALLLLVSLAGLHLLARAHTWAGPFEKLKEERTAVTPPAP